MGFLYLLLIAIWLVINYFIAVAFNEIAIEKGFSDTTKYFWFSFLLGLIGYLMVVSLPDKRARTVMAATMMEKEFSEEREVIPEELRF